LIFSKGGPIFSNSLNVLVESRSARRPVVSDLVFGIVSLSPFPAWLALRLALLLD